MKTNNFLGKFKFVHKLRSEVIGAAGTIIDLGCGKSSPVKFFSDELAYSLGVDSHPASIADSKSLKIHSAYVLSDILEACRKIGDNSFDCALALDVIEHLDKADGKKLLNEMERIAKRKVIIYTPNGFLKQEVFENNQAQKHLSGWSSEEMKSFGFNVYGMSGLRILRQEMGEIKYRPRFAWRLISSLTQIPAYYLPTLAFQILCVKDLNKI